MKCKLTMCVHGVDESPDEFDTLHEALTAAASAVDFNEAAPKELVVSSTIIGHGPVTFDSFQIYAMLELVRE